MKADPGRPPEGMSPFQAIVNLYDESQRLAVELERHSEKMIESVDCLRLAQQSSMSRQTAEAVSVLATEAFAIASRQASIVIDKMRANRAAKCGLVERVFG